MRGPVKKQKIEQELNRKDLSVDASCEVGVNGETSLKAVIRC